MKRKKRWLRWIAWTLLLVLCMNSAGTTVLAVSVEEENIPNMNSTQEGEMRTEDFIPEESTSLSEETSKEENTSPSEETPGEEITPPLEETPGEEITPPLEEIPEEEITPSQGEISEEEKAFEEQIAQEESPKLQEISEGFDIDFYVIIDGNKVKLQHNDITGIATWKDGRTTYHGVSIEDLLRIYEEFGFVKNSESQNPDAIKKFVSAYRGKSRIEYGEVEGRGVPEELPRRGALRRCRRAVRFGRGGLCALRRRAPRGCDAQRRDRAAGKSGRGAASLGGVRRGGDAETRRPGHCPALFLHPAQHLRQAVGRVVGALYGFGGQPHRCHGVVRRRGQARRGGYARRAGDEDPDDGHSRGGAPHRRSRRETPDPRR